MAIEVGKNRIEALGEVEESADLHPLLRLRRWRTTTATTTRWATSATPPSTPDRSCGRTACSPSSARSTSRWRSPPDRPAPRCSAGNTVVFKPVDRLAAVGGQADRGATSTPASRPASINLVMGPGETVGQALQDHPGVDGIVFTGSYEVGMRLFHSFSKTWPRPCIVEMGGKNPAIVSRNADLDEAAEGIMRSRLRVRRPEVLGELARLRRAAGPRRAGPPAGREDRGDRHRRPARPRRTGWARSSTSAPSIGTRRPSPRPVATGPCSSAASG